MRGFILVADMFSSHSLLSAVAPGSATIRSVWGTCGLFGKPVAMSDGLVPNSSHKVWDWN